VLIPYALLLVASFAVRASREADLALSPGQRAVFVQATRGTAAESQRVRIAYRDIHPVLRADVPVVVLLHGSPGIGVDFSTIIPALSTRLRVIVPDLPGFGASTRNVPDYSFRAHAAYVRQLMDWLGVARVHLVGFSMGGGVALSMIDQAPERVRSLTMLSAIGVQELELLGAYGANHVVHGVQLAALWTLREAFPHFGWLDRASLGVPYARNVFDSDQRPLRAILARTAVPMQIVHGRWDALVPVEAALEHHRLVPQSELCVLDGDHFIVLTRAADVAARIDDFIERVERGETATRDTASAARVAAAQRPFDAALWPLLRGIGGVVAAALLLLTALAAWAAYAHPHR
jgi:pimeloyl-ACP methyl ester carboxylesterase